MVEITVDSSYIGYGRYETIIMCGGFDEDSTQLYVTSAQREESQSTLRLEADAAHHIQVIIYFIPKFTPKGKNEPIVDHKPFEAQIKICSKSKSIYDKPHMINAWGGAAIKLNFEL